MTKPELEQSSPTPDPLTVGGFFETVPPGTVSKVIEMRPNKYPYPDASYLSLPEITLYCDNENCLGKRLFERADSVFLGEKFSNAFVHYTCKNCGVTKKTYAIFGAFDLKLTSGFLYKYGEYPQFGPHTPSKVVRILDKEKDYYFKGRQSENQGLGIAALAYYRRVVENQKNKIIDEIIKTVNRVDSGNTQLLTELQTAKSEISFSKAIESIKHAIPQALFINGHNPLTLLHSALSEGLHGKTDTECLEIATSIRVVLTELVERMATVLKDSAEISAAVSKILNRKS